MLKHPPRSPEWLSWLWVASWSLLIFLSVPFARRLQRFVTEHWGRQTFATFTLAVLGIVAVGLLVYLFRALHGLPWRQAAWLTGITAVFFYLSTRLKTPEETLHFIEYGVLGVFCFRALSHRVRDSSIYVRAILLATLVGTFDEILQWITPLRYWEFRDVWLNVVSAALTQLAIWRGLEPTYISGRWAVDSVRRSCRLAIAVIVLLTLCALNTPQRVAWYAARVPVLADLDGNPSVMAEYGYRHKDPEIGVFFSRLTLEELAREDRERGEEVAALIDTYRGPGSYKRFLTDFPSSRDPFVHELRVHLFRRDRYLQRARDETSTEGLDADLATVTWKEQRILDKYFGNALASSTFTLRPWRLRELDQIAFKDPPYVSEVSRHLITRNGEPALLATSLLAIVLLTILPRAARRSLETSVTEHRDPDSERASAERQSGR